MDERGRVPVCEPPPASLPPEEEGHSQRPVLVREVADFTVLPFDDHKDDEIAGRVGLDDLDVRIATLEEACRGFQASSGESKPRRGSPPKGWSRV